MQDFVGQQVDRYRIIAQQGMGGMAVVYKAYDTRLERDVAVKVIRTEAIPPEQYARLMARFEREAKAQAAFSHPNIVPVYDYGEVKGAPYLVMEFIAGGTLKDKLGGPVPCQQALRWLEPIASALSYAHKYGVVHRDVKPSNILFDREGRPVLADFGIAKILETTDVTLTGTGLGVGTPEYMAPEQWQGQASEASDLYALGVVLYELLTGHKPYTAETPVAVALKQMSEPLRRPRDLVRDIPEQVEKLLFKALAPRSQDRFENMQVFHTMLITLLREFESPTPVSIPPVSLPGSYVESVDQLYDVNSEGETIDIYGQPISPIPPPAQQTEPQPPKKTLPAWALWAGLGVLLVGLICIGGMLILSNTNLFSRGGETAPPPASLVESFTQAPVNEDVVEAPTFTEAPASTFTITLEPSPTDTETPPLGVGSTYTRTIDNMQMMYVPAGLFAMGSASNDPNASTSEKPQHEVYLDAYWMDAYEVSNALYAHFVSQTGYRTLAERQGYSYMYDSSWKWTPAEGITWRYPMGDGRSAEDTLPVVHVAYEDAAAYCQWVGARLPTEAEWEKAARGNDGRIFPWGNTFDENFIRYNSNSGPVSVDRFPGGKSPFGVYNLAGNVFEWTSDWYRPDYYTISPRENPSGPSSGELRVMRGGSWNNSQKNVRSAHRDQSNPDYMNYLLGFRCVMDAE